MDPSVRVRRASSFGTVAALYQRYRPGPPIEAVAWLLPAPTDTVIDLGAGTGALTRLLTARAERVIAVEPDERMRSILEAEVAGVTVLEGRGESMPVPDGIADAVLASSAWHWVDPVAGLDEVARVLKPGGLFGAMWSGPDRDGGIWAQARALLDDRRENRPDTGGVMATLGEVTSRPDPVRHRLEIPAGAPFAQPECRVFDRTMSLNLDELVGLLGTYSRVIVLEPDEREALLATVRSLLAERLGPSGDETVDLVFRCRTFRSYLLDRGARPSCGTRWNRALRP